MRACKDCDYSVAIEGEEETLECRRHAITAVGMDEDGYVVSAFPGCDPYMWCGDYNHTVKLGGPSNYAQEW